MGRGMAKNLLEKGNSVVAFDTNAGTLEEAVKIGAVAAGGPKEVLNKFWDWGIKCWLALQKSENLQNIKSQFSSLGCWANAITGQSLF